ncbi:MAG TPA: hypothetical protein VMX17_05055 [Candidatus Glassbacteria bacterium]|nr:hypothetical protein [Candidatus Glassbacteria bacterium]
MKKLYKGTFEFDCSYVKGYWFWKKKIFETVNFDLDTIVLAETKEDAKTMFVQRDNHWNMEYVPYTAWRGWSDYSPDNYDVLKKKVFVKELTVHTFSLLQEKMNTDEFLEYCKQEVVDPITA